MPQSNLPLVSVLMTSYNREKYIAQAIESVLTSSYTNIELIIVDDRSADTTVAIAQQYAANDNRVRIYINEKNLGDYPNRNKAASYAVGKYLKYVDADDAIYPWGLEILVTCMEQFPGAGYGLCSLSQDASRPFPFELSPHEAYRYNYFGPGLFHKAPLSAILLRSAFEAVGGFNNLRMVGDFDMWHRLSAKFPVVAMPHGIVWYRTHDSQEMNDYKKYLGLYEQQRIKALSDPACPLTKEELTKIKQRITVKYKSKALKSLAKLNWAEAGEYWKIRKSFF